MRGHVRDLRIRGEVSKRCRSVRIVAIRSLGYVITCGRYFLNSGIVGMQKVASHDRALDPLDHWLEHPHGATTPLSGMLKGELSDERSFRRTVVKAA